MQRFLLSTIVTLSLGAATTAADSQSLADRVSRAPDGIVRLQFPSRPGTCGDGKEMIGYRKAFFASSFQSYGTWTASECVEGPVRVALTVTAGKVTGMKVSAGPHWAASQTGFTDLGAIGAAEASAYFFALVPQLEGRAKDSRLLLPAVLADDDSVLPRLTNLARDNARSNDTRRQAIHWLGMLGDATTVPTLVAFAKQGGDLRGNRDDINNDDDGPGDRGLATSAVAALSFIENGAGIPALIELANTSGSATRSAAVFWLGQSGDARAMTALHRIIENQGENDRIRARAIFSLTHSGETSATEFSYLAALYPRLNNSRIKEAVIQGMGEDKINGSRWLLDRARDASESTHLRRQALFWAGQSDATPTRDIVAFYRSASDRELRDHAIFVLSQRQDDAALTELMRIASEDSDKQSRKKAMFWLGQKDDPRVTKLITDRLSH